VKKTVLALTLLAACAAEDGAKSKPAYRFENGLWFNDQSFAPATTYVVDGALQFSNSVIEAENVVDLAGGYAVPPFCEGHNHNFGGGADQGEFEDTVRAYLEDGVFYAMMPGSFELYRGMIADKINNPKSVDVAFANNAITGSGGHPRRLREFLMERYGSYPEFTKETMPDKGYFEADTLDQLREKWALVLAERPDFIKAVLIYSEEYERRKDKPEFYGNRGLNPELLPELVRMAHDANLRIAVHVDTDADMATALRTGADIIVHLPSNNSTARLSDETIALAKESGVPIVTTLSIAKRYEEREPEKYAAILDAQRDSLVGLTKAGANLVVGSDTVWDTSRGEVEHLASLGVLDNLTILKMWTDSCARTVFPERKIGKLAEGYEASFLVLDGDPIADFDATSRIKLRVKDGQVLELDPSTAAADDDE
jgi:imidazolonepropionase-like amidohydrolase